MYRGPGYTRVQGSPSIKGISGSGCAEVDTCFEPFQKINVFSYNDYTVARFQEALSECPANAPQH